ncbi:unnamed protein product [Orchesella dallaii]|uniref:mRNA-capping enzyme n=1 Tax=Orchesella dallaii TaxID=48710 RepID=A0ABP1PS29_9HEXA
MSNYHGGGRRQNNNGGVPPRWLNCPRKSEGFIAEKFLVFKTPLSSRYDNFVSAEKRFYPQMIVDYVKMRNIRIGLWIDLTNTERFYPRDFVEGQGIRYVKLQCRGHGETPSEEQTTQFINMCREFTDDHPDDLIGVHCTHGFNRSGFLICAFLAQENDFCIDAAILHFAKLRPPGIYKQDYIDELCRLYGTPDDSVPKAPELPDWCYEDEDVDDDDGFASGNHAPGPSSSMNMNGKRPHNDAEEGRNNVSNGKRRKREFFKDNPTFMEGVPGVTPITDRQMLTQLQRKVQNMCGWEGSGFPGSQPVSMDINNVNFLAEKPYMVSWKADGTRYLMLIDGPTNVYFIDRDNCVFHAPEINFFFRETGDHIFETLVDGEMVIDKVNGTLIPRYLIYDIIKFRGEDVGKVDFRIRLNCIRDELINPRYKAMERGIIDRQAEPFGVRFKPFWFLEDTEKILNGKLAQELSHEPDGTIFQPVKEPYTCGRCDSVLKWKPPHLNTVDFRLKIVTHSGEGLLTTRIGELYVGGLSTPYSKMKVSKAISNLHNKIVECKFDNGNWTFLRERTDKSFPNAYSTAKAVCQSICQPVTKDFLLDFIANRRWRKSHN